MGELAAGGKEYHQPLLQGTVALPLLLACQRIRVGREAVVALAAEEVLVEAAVQVPVALGE
jgi:hypothetical protein